MAFQLVQVAASPANLNTNVVTFNTPITPGNMVVGVNGGFFTTCTGIADDKGNTYTQTTTGPFFLSGSSQGFYHQMFYLTNIQFNPSQLTFTMNSGGGGNNPTGMYAAEFTPSGYFDKFFAQGGGSNPVSVSGIVTTNTLTPNQNNSLIVAMEAAVATINSSNPGVNPLSGGAFKTIYRDVTNLPPITPGGGGPAVCFQYENLTTGIAQGIGTGFFVNDERTDSLIISFAPTPVNAFTGQVCVG